MSHATEGFEIETKPAHCEKHGDYVSRRIAGVLRLWSRCIACQDERDAEEKAAREERNRQESALRWQQKIGMACIPERFKSRRLESFEAETPGQKHAHEAAKGYADDFARVSAQNGRSLVFIGKPGTGKTHLAIGIALQVMEAGHSALFVTVMRAIRRVKDTWGKSGESESDAIAAIVAPDLLILDEVGIQFGSETEKLILFDILNERYELRKPCILLSNFTLPEVQAFLGERIFDRLREDGGQVVPFDWDSHRGRA